MPNVAAVVKTKRWRHRRRRGNKERTRLKTADVSEANFHVFIVGHF